MLMIEVNRLSYIFSFQRFLKEIENMFSMFLSSYRHTRESLGELEKTVETLTCQPVSQQHFSFSQTFTCVSSKQLLDYEFKISITRRNREQII